MKRLLKFFAFLGGLGAVGWLVRHRLVGMTLNREPQTPEPAPEPQAPEPTHEQEAVEATPEQEAVEAEDGPPPSTTLVDVLGVSSEDAERLESAGISTVKQLAIADAAELAEKTGLDEDRLSGWMEKAAALV